MLVVFAVIFAVWIAPLTLVFFVGWSIGSARSNPPNMAAQERVQRASPAIAIRQIDWLYSQGRLAADVYEAVRAELGRVCVAIGTAPPLRPAGTPAATSNTAAPLPVPPPVVRQSTVPSRAFSPITPANANSSETTCDEVVFIAADVESPVTASLASQNEAKTEPVRIDETNEVQANLRGDAQQATPVVATPIAAPAASASPAMPAVRRMSPKVETADPAEPTPRRTWTELLSSFMEDRNIRWGELLSGMLIIGSATGLVMSLREPLQQAIPYFPSLLFLLFIGMIHGAGLYTHRRWKLETTSQGVLVIGTLLVPLGLLAACLFSAQSEVRSVTDPLFLLAVTIGVAGYGWMTFASSRVLLPQFATPLTVSIMGASASLILIKRLGATPIGWSVMLATIGVATVSAAWMISQRRTGWSDEDAGEYGLALGLPTFALCIAAGYWTSLVGPARDGVGVVMSVIAAWLAIAASIWTSRCNNVRWKIIGIAMQGLMLVLLAVSHGFAWMTPLTVALSSLVAVGILAIGLRLASSRLTAIAMLAMAAPLGVALGSIATRLACGSPDWQAPLTWNDVFSASTGLAWTVIAIGMGLGSYGLQRPKDASGDATVSLPEFLRYASLAYCGAGWVMTLLFHSSAPYGTSIATVHSLLFSVVLMGFTVVHRGRGDVESNNEAVGEPWRVALAIAGVVIGFLGFSIWSSAITVSLAATIVPPLSIAWAATAWLATGFSLLASRQSLEESKPFMQSVYTILAVVAAVATAIALLGPHEMLPPSPLSLFAAISMAQVALIAGLLLPVHRNTELASALMGGLQLSTLLATAFTAAFTLGATRWPDIAYGRATQGGLLALTVWAVVWAAIERLQLSHWLRRAIRSSAQKFHVLTTSLLLLTFGHVALLVGMAFGRVPLSPNSLAGFASLAALVGLLFDRTRTMPRGETDVSGFNLGLASVALMVRVGLSFPNLFAPHPLGIAWIVSVWTLAVAAVHHVGQRSVEPFDKNQDRWRFSAATVGLLGSVIGAGLPTIAAAHANMGWPCVGPVIVVSVAMLLLAIPFDALWLCVVGGLATVGCVVAVSHQTSIQVILERGTLAAGAWGWLWAVAWAALCKNSDSDQRTWLQGWAVAAIAPLTLVATSTISSVVIHPLDAVPFLHSSILGWCSVACVLSFGIGLMMRHDASPSFRQAWISVACVTVGGMALGHVHSLASPSTGAAYHLLTLLVAVASLVVNAAYRLQHRHAALDAAPIGHAGQSLPRVAFGLIVTAFALALRSRVVDFVGDTWIGAPWAAWIGVILAASAVWLALQSRISGCPALSAILAAVAVAMTCHEQSATRSAMFYAPLATMQIFALGWGMLVATSQRQGLSNVAVGRSTLFPYISAWLGAVVLGAVAFLQPLWWLFFPNSDFGFWSIAALQFGLCMACLFDDRFSRHLGPAFASGTGIAVGAGSQFESSLLVSSFLVALHLVIAGMVWRRRDAWNQLFVRFGSPARTAGGGAIRGWLVPCILTGSLIVTAVTIPMAAGWAGHLLRWERFLAAFTPLLAALAVGQIATANSRRGLHHLALILGALGVMAISWADRSYGSMTGLDQLVRTLTALVAFTVAMGTTSKWLQREDWLLACRQIFIGGIGASLVLLCVLLGREWAAFEPGAGDGLTVVQGVSVAVYLTGMAFAMVLAAVDPRRDPFGLSDDSRVAYVYGSQAVLGLLAAHIYLCFPQLFFWNVGWPYVVMGVAFASVGLGRWLERSPYPVLGDPTIRTSLLLPLLSLVGLFVQPEAGEFWIVMTITAVIFLWVGTLKQSWLCTVAAVLFANAALWSFYTESSLLSFVRNPQAWLIPPALSILSASQYYRSRISPSQLGAIRYICAGVIYISSCSELFIHGLGDSLWPPIALAALSILGVFAGIGMRIRAFVYFGASFLLMAILAMVTHAGRAFGHVWPWWAFGIGAGIGILVLFGFFEKRREDAKRLLQEFRQWN